MEQFSLNKWLQDKSCKVVTRDGREVELYYSPTSRIPLIGATTSDNEIHQYTKDGFQCDTFNQAKNDIFFADEEEELTEFEKAVDNIINYPHFQDEQSVKQFSKALLDLARKELQKECDREATFKYHKELERKYDIGFRNGYDTGKQDALKSMPKWKKCPNTTGPFIDDFKGEEYLYLNDYVIKISELEKLPKEE